MEGLRTSTRRVRAPLGAQSAVCPAYGGTIDGAHSEVPGEAAAVTQRAAAGTHETDIWSIVDLIQHCMSKLLRNGHCLAQRFRTMSFGQSCQRPLDTREDHNDCKSRPAVAVSKP